MQEIGKFDVEINVIPNGLEKYMAFTINLDLVFIDSMQFMNSSLDALVKNLSDNSFNYLSEEFRGEFLKLIRQKGVFPYGYVDSFENFSENKLPERRNFFSSFLDECIS